MSTPQIFPPTLREVMFRGRWIAVLAACLVAAGIFAFLGQWQLDSAIDRNPPPPGITEEVRELDEVVAIEEYLPEPLVGQKVDVAGEFVAGDFIIVSSRFNDGEEGYWVTGQLRVDERTSLAVALGWSEDLQSAQAAADALESTAPLQWAGEGRLISDEGVQEPPADDPFRLDRMSPAALLGQWHDIDELQVYRPYLAAASAPEGLVDITSHAPEELSPINWLNIFYAIEWVIFAGFAFYLWYRLAKDAWERELEDLEEAVSES